MKLRLQYDGDVKYAPHLHYPRTRHVPHLPQHLSLVPTAASRRILMAASDVAAPSGNKGPAIHAEPMYIKFGTGASKNFGFTKHVFIAMTAGIGAGLIWKVRACDSVYETG